MRGFVWNGFWTGIQTLLGLVVVYLSERRVTLQDLIVALIFGVLGTALFLIVSHPRFWKRPAVGPADPALIQQKAETGSFGAAYQAGRDMTVHQATATPAELFADAPHLLWSNVRAFRDDHTYRVIVRCNNVGKTAQLIAAFSWVESTVDVLGSPIPGTVPVQTTVMKQKEAIDLIQFDKGGHIEPTNGQRPFDLNMRCLEDDPIPGEREVRWRLTYMDDDMARGYITECSVRLAFVGIGEPRIVGTPALDNTSRKDRNDHYDRFMRDKKAPSTGLRRED